MTSSERRREAAHAKIGRKEVKHQAYPKLCFKKPEIQLQSMKFQLKLDVAVEEWRQKLVEAFIEQAEHLEDASEISGLCRSRATDPSGEPNGGRQDKKLGENSITSSVNG